MLLITALVIFAISSFFGFNQPFNFFIQMHFQLGVQRYDWEEPDEMLKPFYFAVLERIKFLQVFVSLIMKK